MTVTGRNGFDYDAKHIKDNYYVVGRFVVIVENGKVTDTVCRATKVNLKGL